ncbi:MAG TPA: precorrin-6y C5,15-methyltransferase (decarboxylating) subunit CbiE [Leptolyngbyaceae cyanobacterium]
MTRIHVVGIGLEGCVGLPSSVLALVQEADLLMGSARHLAYFPDFLGKTWPITDFQTALDTLKVCLTEESCQIVVLTSGDPLFFGLGRLLLAELPPEQLTFHPHVSSIQLAFSRIKAPWQNATLVSAHGRSTETLVSALRRGDELIAVLTDGTHTPEMLTRLLLDLNLPLTYWVWVCENLGGENEQVQRLTPQEVIGQTFASLNVVIFQRQPVAAYPKVDLDALPRLGLPDAAFASFEDRPGLMTKREVRLLVLGELGLAPGQTIWDIGAGTGSVSVEMGRLVPDASIYAVEKTAMGSALIEQNCRRFAVSNVVPIHGTAPTAVKTLPSPDRVFIGGSGGHLAPLLDLCHERMKAGGKIVLALATLEHLSQVMQWLEQTNSKTEPVLSWEARYLQAQFSRSVGIAALTRWQPLNPVTLAVLTRMV